MDARLEGMYLDWLYSKVDRPGDPCYSKLMTQLFRTNFTPIVPNDDNRADDGIHLRRVFIFEGGASSTPDKEWFEIECSMLELLVALAISMSYQADVDEDEAFWHMLRNVGVNESFSDETFDAYALDNIVTRIIWRTYSPDGDGGLFPLKEATRDQRDVELLYQMYTYVMENDYFN